MKDIRGMVTFVRMVQMKTAGAVDEEEREREREREREVLGIEGRIARVRCTGGQRKKAETHGEW